MERKSIYRLIVAAFAVLLSASCVDDSLREQPMRPADSSPLKIYASISGPGKASTRAAVTTTDDKWSYTDFTDGDFMGFYSSGGNYMDNNKDFVNQELKFDKNEKKFSGHDVEFSPSDMSGSKIFMYYPYSKDMDGDGMVLRRKEKVKVNDDDEKESEIEKCVDFLSADELTMEGVVNNEEVALFGTFYHHFSELIIMRGEGFDKPPKGNEGITVVLREPCTHIKVNYIPTDEENGWKCTPELVCESNADKDKARKWVAWQGGNYGITNDDPDGLEAWYVVVPTLGCDAPMSNKKRPGLPRSTVEYIEICDNDGYWHQVSSLRLSGGNSKYLDAGWRYPMEITMKELVPTVNPFKVVPWNWNSEDVDLTDERKRGIENEAAFKNWVRDYNAYLADKNDDEKYQKLFKYGDAEVDGTTKETTWHFYLLYDLDLAGFTYEGIDGMEDMSVIIPKLHDILDGKSTTLENSQFVNHKIAGLSKTFIGTLAGSGAAVQNIDFIKPRVVYDNASTDAAGIIVKEMSDGATVDHCNINNGWLYNPGGPGGMVTGSMGDNCSVKNCTLAGILIAESTADDDGENIVGEVKGTGAYFENNDADSVVNEEN